MGASWAQAAVGLESDRLRANTLAHAYMQAMTIPPTSPEDRCVRTVSVVARPLRKNRTVSDVARARGVLLFCQSGRAQGLNCHCMGVQLFTRRRELPVSGCVASKDSAYYRLRCLAQALICVNFKRPTATEDGEPWTVGNTHAA